MVYELLTERILKLIKKEVRINPTKVAEILKEEKHTVSATMYYLFKQGKLKKERVRRNVFYSIK